jgi:hypothetical protein
MWTKILGIISVGFDIKGQALVIFFLHSSDAGEEMGVQ